MDDSDDATVTAADAAIKAAEDAIAAGNDLPEGDTDTDSETVKMLASTLADAKTSREVAMGGAARDMRNRIIGKDRAIERAANIGTAGPTEANIIIRRAAGAAASVSVRTPAGYSPSDMPAMSNGSWAGTHLERRDSGATQHLFVYTDKGPPTRQQFYDFDRDPATTPRYTDTSAPSHTDPYKSSDPLTPLDLSDIDGAGTTGLTRGWLDDNFMSPGPAADGDVRQTFRVASSTATSVAFKGNYNGAAGTYTCTTAAGTNCVVTISPGGTYAETTGTWTFTPELNVTAWRDDSEFISFGWWMQEPDSPNGAYTFEYYADGTAYTAPSAIATGTATYSGRAAGKYVVQEMEDGGVTGGVAHQFTAAATLTASFGAAANSISGTISGFTADDGSSPGWEVTLHEKLLGAQANLANAFPAISETDPMRSAYDGVTATIGDQTAYGDWAGQYFGNASAANSYPLGVGGTFQADNESVSIGGAFGARRPQ